MSELVYRLPMPPSLNNIFANVAGKGRVRTQSYRIWANAAGWAVKAQSVPREPITSPSAIEIVCNPRGDLSNRIKAVEDLLVSLGVIKDDSLFHDVHVIRGGSNKEALITVREIAA